MELDIRDGRPTKVDAIRYADNRVIASDANSYNVNDNTGGLQFVIPKDALDTFIAALNAARKILE
jgi:hypothetical protein